MGKTTTTTTTTKNRDNLKNDYASGKLLTGEQLSVIAEGSGHVKWRHDTDKHHSKKSLNGDGAIWPTGEIERPVLAEIVKAFIRCGFWLLVMGFVSFVVLAAMGVI